MVMNTATELEPIEQYCDNGYQIHPVKTCLKYTPDKSCKDCEVCEVKYPFFAGKKQTDDIDQFQILLNKHFVSNWLNAVPGRKAGVGICTEGTDIIIIDCDPEAETWRIEHITELSKAGGISKTPRGGYHYYFKQRPGEQIRSSRSKISAGVDIIAGAGSPLYAVEYPSAGYEWQPGNELVALSELPEVPESLLISADPVSQANKVKLDLDITADLEISNLEDMDDIPEGQRNGELVRIAGKLANYEVGEQKAIQQLHKINQAKCKPPVDEQELAGVISSYRNFAQKYQDKKNNKHKNSSVNSSLKAPAEDQTTDTAFTAEHEFKNTTEATGSHQSGAKPAGNTTTPEPPPEADEDPPQAEGMTLTELLLYPEYLQPPIQTKTGFQCLDDMTKGGYWPGLHIIGGRTSEGKSTLARQMALNLTRSVDIVFYHALEDMLCDTLGSLKKALTDKDKPDRLKVYSWTGEVTKVFSEYQKCLAEAADKKMRMAAVIDQLSWLSTDTKTDSDYQRITEITKYITGKSLELEIPVVVVHQINRAGNYSRQNGQSIGAQHLKDSGRIEEDAGTICIIQKLDPNNGQMTVDLVKCRRGQRGYSFFLKVADWNSKRVIDDPDRPEPVLIANNQQQTSNAVDKQAEIDSIIEQAKELLKNRAYQKCELLEVIRKESGKTRNYVQRHILPALCGDAELTTKQTGQKHFIGYEEGVDKAIQDHKKTNE